MKLSKYIPIIILFCFLLFIVLITQNVHAYDSPPKYCFTYPNDCGSTPTDCNPKTTCYDTYPAYNAKCEQHLEYPRCPYPCAYVIPSDCVYELIPVTLNLSANPSSGTAPLLNVKLTANLSSTLKDVTVLYRFNCGDGVWSTQSGSNTYTCNYANSGNFTASAEARYSTSFDGWQMRSNQIIIKVDPPIPTCTISANPSSIVSGNSSTLTWSSTNATSCTGTGAWSGTKAVSGSASVYPTTTSTYGLSCTGSGGTRTCSTTVTVVPAFDFTVLVNPPSGSVTRDDSVQTTVTITKTQGTAANVSLSASSLPTGVTARFSPVSCTPNSTCTSTLTLTANSTAPAVTNDNIIITGTSGSIVNTTTYTLTVFVPTLSCALTAIPSSGQAPLNDVDLSANVSGTATGSIVYKFDCTNNGTWEHTSSATTTDPYRINNLCDYATANIYTAKAQVTRGGLTAECPVTITVTNDAPNVPVLIAPPNNVWINYNPTFQATVSDLGDQVRAQFQVIGAATYIGNYVTGSGTSSTGPVVLTNSSNDFCFNNTWHARAQDISGLLSDWSTYWRVKVDKVAPETVAVSSPAIAVTTQIPVTLTEIDSCSGIQAGDVDVSINGGSWVNTGLPSGGAIINDFNYTGIDNNTYRFRYRVQDNAGNWSGYVYSVTTTVDINNPPVLGSLSRSASNQCMTAPYYTFVWTYSDADGDTGTLLEFQVDNNSDYSSPTINRSVNVNYVNGTVYNQTGILSTIATPDYLLFNTRYYWRARVSDEHGLFSAWVSGSSFLTSLHHYPMVDFINIPLKPNVNESTQFTDASICYDNVSTGSSCSDPNDSFKWIFLYGNPSTSTLENPIVEFTESGNQSVTLEVEDSDGFTCSLTKTLRINYALPKWKEIAPF